MVDKIMHLINDGPSDSLKYGITFKQLETLRNGARKKTRITTQTVKELARLQILM